MMRQALAVKKDMTKQCEVVSGLLRLMSHPQRLMLMCSLLDGELTVGQIESACGASQSAVSQFLKELRLEGLVDSRREGKFVYYRIADGRVHELIRALHKIFC